MKVLSLPAPLVGVLLGLGAVLLVGCSASTSDTSAPDPASTSSSTGTPSPTRTPPRPSAVPSRPQPSKPPSAAEQALLDRRLIAAAWDDDVQRARRLITQGADVNAQDSTQQSAFLIATSEGYYELLELTLRHGADVDARDSYNGTGLIRAAERGHWDVVGRLVRAGTPVDHVNNLGWTALLEAIILGDGSERYVDTVRVLVAGGADVRLASASDGITPLSHAESGGQTAVAALLRAALDQRSLDRAVAERLLLRSATTGDPDGAALALRAGAELEARDDQERTALLLAATHDRVAVARLLVAAGADPDALDARHDTPWLVTGVTGSVAMLEVMLLADPDLGIRNRFGGVSLIPASERGHVAYVRRVVRTGIDVDHVNDLGWTALLEAVILGDGSKPYQQIVRTLLAAGADPAITDRDGRTALQHASANGQTAVARILERRS